MREPARDDWSGSTPGERVRYLIERHCGGDRGHFASLTAVPRSRVADIDRGRAEPTADELRAIKTRMGLNHHWVMSGEGQPTGMHGAPAGAGSALIRIVPEADAVQAELAAEGEADRELSGLPAAGAPMPAPAAGAQGLDALRELLNQIKGVRDLAGAIATLQDEVLGLQARELDPAEVRAILKDDLDAIRRDVAAMPDRFAAAIKVMGEDSAAYRMAREAKGYADGAWSKINEMGRKADALAGRLDIVMDRKVDGLAIEVEQFGERLAKLAEIAPAPTAAGPGDLGAILGRIEARLNALEDAARARPARAPRPAVRIEDIRFERDLPEDAELTPKEWAAKEGPHQRLIRDIGDTKTLGKRLHAAYRQMGRPSPSEVMDHARYPVRELRTYVEWLSRAGLAPTEADWLEHWSKNHPQIGG